MKDLIDRLEQASEGSRELDDAIAITVWDKQRLIGNAGEAKTLMWQHNGVRRSVSPRFTESVDDAMTLIPKGYDYGFSYSKQSGLEVWVQKPFRAGPCFQGFAPEGVSDDRTRAIAICIAALRARTAEETP